MRCWWKRPGAVPKGQRHLPRALHAGAAGGGGAACGAAGLHRAQPGAPPPPPGLTLSRHANNEKDELNVGEMGGKVVKMLASLGCWASQGLSFTENETHGYSLRITEMSGKPFSRKSLKFKIHELGGGSRKKKESFFACAFCAFLMRWCAHSLPFQTGNVRQIESFMSRS